MEKYLQSWRIACIDFQIGDEIAQELQVDEKRAQWIESAAKHTYTINETCLQEDGSNEFSEYIPDERVKMPEDELMESYDKKELRRLLDTIDRREACVLKMRYGLDNSEPMTLREVSKNSISVENGLERLKEKP